MAEHAKKRNFALLVSALLPLLLLLIVGGIELYNRSVIAVPQYDALFAIQGKPLGAGFCEDSRITNWPLRKTDPPTIQFTYHRQSQPCTALPRFFRYRSSSGVNEEIVIDEGITPSAKDFHRKSKTISREIPELSHLTLKHHAAPDGYTFEVGTYRNRPSFLFFQNHHRDTPLTLRNSGRRVEIPAIEGENYYFSNNVIFLGWIVDEQR